MSKHRASLSVRCTPMAALWLVACVLLVDPAAALADKDKGKEDEATQQARLHNAMGKKLFSLGLFKEAAEEYEQAYRAKPAPAFLFNLAQCHKRVTAAADLKKAIFYFKSYLQNVPDSPMRKEIEEEVEKLERQHRLMITPPPPFYKRWWFWTVVGVALAGATVGTVLALQPEDMEEMDGSAGRFVVAP